MKIATFNVNNVNKRLPNLLTWLKSSQPDVVCLTIRAGISKPRSMGSSLRQSTHRTGNPQPGPKFDYKLAWLKRLDRHASKLLKTGAPVVLAGDFNVVPTDADIYPTKSWDTDALVQPQARKLYKTLLDHGWTDSLLELHPDRRPYTFWSYWRNRFERDAGLRIDHILLSPDLALRLAKAGVDRKVRGRENASDHAPTWITLR